MGFSSQLHEWAAAIKEVAKDEHKKHPYLSWLVLIVAFIYALTRMMSR
jgi:hypothetical protein